MTDECVCGRQLTYIVKGEGGKPGGVVVELYWPDGGRSRYLPNKGWQVLWSNGNWVKADGQHSTLCDNLSGRVNHGGNGQQKR